MTELQCKVSIICGDKGMLPNRIEKLTPEQEALIPVYREKWRTFALSTEPIDHEKAAEAVKAAYAVMGLWEPGILFFDSPNAAHKFKQLLIQRGNLLKSFWMMS